MAATPGHAKRTPRAARSTTGKTHPRTKNTPYQRDSRTADHYRGKAHGYVRETISHKAREQRTTGVERESDRRVTHTQIAQDRFALTKYRGQIRQQQINQQQQGTGTYAPSVPSVNFAGGITRSIFMAIVLIFVYALVTHSVSSAGAIGNIGGIFGKLTSTQPLFNPATKTG